MARVGFKKTFAAGTFDKAAVQTLFGHIKTYVTNAGFNILLDTASEIDIIRMGAQAGTAHDDIPHWAFTLYEDNTNGGILAYPVYGNNYLDANSRGFPFVDSRAAGDPPQEFTIWFAADGAAGWWWVCLKMVTPSSSNGVSTISACAGTTTRRYPSDTHQGLCARYGIWYASGSWCPAYSTDSSGARNDAPWTSTWSPLGKGGGLSFKRHPGSPLQKMAVPQFPCREDGISACILGEFNEILAITDGYAHEEVVVPGWIALTGGDSDQPYVSCPG